MNNCLLLSLIFSFNFTQFHSPRQTQHKCIEITIQIIMRHKLYDKSLCLPQGAYVLQITSKANVNSDITMLLSKHQNRNLTTSCVLNIIIKHQNRNLTTSCVLNIIINENTQHLSDQPQKMIQ